MSEEEFMAFVNQCPDYDICPSFNLENSACRDSINNLCNVWEERNREEEGRIEQIAGKGSIVNPVISGEVGQLLKQKLFGGVTI